MVAEANAQKVCRNADLDAQLATAEAEMNILLANNASKRQAAQSYLDAVKARFASRVEQVKAERIVDAAGEQAQMALKRTDLAAAVAKATAAREESSRKLAELQRRQAELQTASLTDWSEKLATYKNAATEFDVTEVDASEYGVIGTDTTLEQSTDETEGSTIRVIDTVSWGPDARD